MRDAVGQRRRQPQYAPPYRSEPAQTNHAERSGIQDKPWLAALATKTLDACRHRRYKHALLNPVLPHATSRQLPRGASRRRLLERRSPLFLLQGVGQCQYCWRLVEHTGSRKQTASNSASVNGKERMSHVTKPDEFPSCSLACLSYIGDHFRLRVALRVLSGSRVSTIADSSPK